MRSRILFPFVPDFPTRLAGWIAFNAKPADGIGCECRKPGLVL